MIKLFLGCFLTPSLENEYRKDKKNQYVISATTFQRAFLSSFNDMGNVSIINAPEIGSWPKRSRWLRFKGGEEFYEGVLCKHTPFINITYIKRFSILYSLYKHMKNWAIQQSGEKLIIVYSLIHPYLKAAVKIKKKYPNIKLCCIVLDLPQYFGDTNTLVDKLTDKSSAIYKLSEEIDSFVLLTNQMVDALNIKNKPWMLLEGIYKPVDIPYQEKIHKTILYTGKLDARFGIRDLIDSFVNIDDAEAQLWICGNGMDKDYVVDATIKDSRIKYYGVVSQEEVFKLQKRVSILVNPRRPEGEYTKYSFPSKTMEYLASGTPTVMYHLPGMPDEYLPFVEIIDQTSPNGLKDSLEKMLTLTQTELDELGMKARNFILQNKTAEKQMNRFKHFIELNYEK